jgi:hypothetical protein
MMIQWNPWKLILVSGKCLLMIDRKMSTIKSTEGSVAQCKSDIVFFDVFQCQSDSVLINDF